MILFSNRIFRRELEPPTLSPIVLAMFQRLLMVTLVLASPLGDTLKASELKWDRTEVTLEMEPDQSEIRASFVVTNYDETPVRISRIETSCGCTGSIIDRKILEPGKSSEIIAVFNRGRREGLNRNRLEVFIDGQREPVATLRMAVDIPTLIEAIPRIVFWSPNSSKTDRQVAISLDKRYVNEIIDLKYNEDRLNVVVEKNPETPEKLILKIIPDSFDSLQRETITLYARGPGGREAQAEIHSLVQP